MSRQALGAEIRFATLAGMLRARAAERPDQLAFTFLADGEVESERLTYAQLDRRAAAIAAALREVAAPGDRALLLYPSGLELVAAFFGCLYAGVVAVPAYPPRPNDRSQSRLRSIARDAGPRVALTTLEGLEGARRSLPGAPELFWLPTDVLEASDPAAPLPEPDPQALAFLQYTSGSTADPKGVMVTHANLLHNERMIGEAFGMDEESVVLGWLPLYHDMGLIGNVLQPLHAGARCVLMPPVAFLQRPMRWLEAISRYRATTSGGPNFAYELCLRKAAPEALAGLDLSSWRVAFDGAEPVRASTLERFAAAFAPYGFRPEAFYPCYGLAEATLFVTGGEPGSRPRTAGSRVSCGHVWMGQRLAIADPETGVELPAGAEGEIWLAGPSVARGYWNNAAATARDFNAFLETGEGPFLRTGDLGVLDGGELFVTGRIKDLIILRGRNLHPQDVELTAERSHPDLRPGSGAAFSVEVGGEERLVAVHEVERRRREGFEEVAEAVRRAVAEEHEAQVYEVVLIRTAGLPKTSSGKVQRGLCRRLYLTDGLPVVSRNALAAGPAAESALILTRDGLAALEPAERQGVLVAWLRERAAAVLGAPVSAISPDQPLTGLGLDSLTAVELKGSVEALGFTLPLVALLRGAGIAELADGMLAEPVAEIIPPRALSLDGDQPLSPGQKALWFLERLAPDAGVYNVAVAAWVREGLDVHAFHRALSELAARHEALRTVIQSVDGEPMQRAVPGLEPDVVILDATGWDDEELPRRLAAEAWRPFELQAGSPLRVRIYERMGGERVVLLAVHHLVCDFWSLAVAARELAALYVQETGGPRAVLEPPALRYSDFVHWQGDLLAGVRGEELRGYWSEALAGVRDLDLPTDRPRPAVQTWRGGSRALRLPPELADGVRSLAASRGATLFMTLLAAFEVQLGRTARQDDFAVGTPTSGRGGPELAGVMGYFVNPVALRTGLAGDPTFEELLDRARRTTLAGLEHADLPFPWVAERLRPVRDPGRPPVFQVMFVLQRGRPQDDPGLAAFGLGEDGARISLGGLTLESVRLPERRAQFELSLGAAELPEGGLLLSLEHNADLFDPATAERALRCFRTLLTAAVASPATPVEDLSWLEEGERRQLLEWSAAPAVVEPARALHELVFEWVERTPEAPAVVYEGETLTYGELGARALRLAGTLRALGVGPETLVGLYAERSPELVAGMLGVLAAGAAWMPLDPSYPGERLAAMVEDGAPRVILARRRRMGELPAARVLALEDALEAGEAAGSPAPADGRQLAYVIFTSGSTGRPKGVAVPHRALVNRLLRAREAFGIGPADAMLQRAPTGFDASVWETFGPLAAGGRVVLARADGPRDPAYLLGLIAAERVTLMDITPSALEILLDQEDVEERTASLRIVWVGAEATSPGLVERFRERVRAPLINTYGPTEAAVDLVWHRFRPEVDGATAPIGRPIEGCETYVLDGLLEPVPAGVSGELWLGGIALARGYLGRPDLTAEAFRPHPFAHGERLYRTGDLVRWRADGVLEFLGRVDDQVKIRGIRVEPGEAETALRRLPGVREAAVVAVKDGAGVRLAAFLVADPAPDARELRIALAASLPEAFIPSVFVPLPELPRAPSGKIDRRELARTAPLPDTSSDRYIAPRNPTEELLAGIWAELLGLERVGVQDDFFALGGHSLLATRVVSRISRVFGIALPVSDLFTHPTVERLASRIAAAAAPPAPPIRPVPRRPGWALPASHAQRRLWFLDRLEPESASYNLPGQVSLSGPLDLPALAASLAEIVRRHEALRTVFRTEAGEPVQAEGPARNGLPLVDLGGLPAGRAERESERLAREEASRPFDLGRGPLHRAIAVRLAPEEHALLFTLHHIVADGWSYGVLFDELTALYAACSAGRPSPLAELPLQYADYAVWQREWLRGEVLEAQLAWWRQRLAGAPVLELPADHPRLASRSFRGGLRRAVLPAELALAAGHIGRREGATLFMVLLAAFQAQLARYTGDESVTVGSPVANRGRIELEGLIGFFVNALALRTPVGDDPSFLALLARVREVCLGAYAHQDVPFERLVEELRPERQLARNPLFQVVFLVEEPLLLHRLGGLAVETRAVETGTAKFDLTLSVAPGPEVWNLALEYDAGLFDPATAERMLGHWRILLEGAAADPAAPLSELPLFTGAERQQVFTEWNDTQARYPEGACLHHLVAAQAERTPDAVAVVGERERLTYGELWERSGRVAWFLRAMGIGPEMRVGFCLERTPDMLAVMLGILRAGGAYLALDPAYPRERLELMLTDGGAVALLTESALEGRVPAFDGPVVLIDRELAAVPVEGPEDSSEVGDRNLAYVIYTSGSTGRPKGVAIEHHSAVTLVRWALATFPWEDLRGSLAATSVCFDISVFEIFVTLAMGGRLILVPNVVALPAVASTDELTIVNAVPSPMAELVGGRLPERLRTVNLGGEALKAELVERIYAHPQVERVCNLYGPTEDTTYSTYSFVPRGTAHVTIGRPIANTQARVLGRNGELMPAGAPGELFLGGGGVTRGYLGRPDVTAERFVPDPFGPPGSRMYRTGDRARLLPDGQIDYLGRFDHQVKIHGNRIELGEIETVLEQHPAVRQAVAAVRADGSETARLVGYVVPEDEAADGDLPAELTTYLRGILPGIMVPTVWVVLPAFPLSPNGKVDRRALPAPTRSGHGETVAPRNTREESLAAIFREVLGVEELGIHDDFFELGGHSLMAIRTVFRVAEVCGFDVPVSALFQAPTVASLAEWLEAARPAMAAPSAAAAPEGPCPLSLAQRRLWLIDRLQPGSALYNVSIPLRLEGQLDVALLGRALAEILRRHEPLRTVYAAPDGEPVQVVLPPPPEPPLRRLSLAGLPEPMRRAETLGVLRGEAELAFDLERGPVARFLLVELGPAEHVLAATFHHIATDGWSMGVFSRELTAIYQAFAAGEPSPLPELPLRYADYAVAQRRALADGPLVRQLDYWRSQLAGIPILELPADHPRPPQPSHRGATRRVALPAGLAKTLETVGRAEGITPFMVLLAGFAASLSRLSGQDDFGIGVPSAGRSRAETREMIGFFVNTLVLRPGLGGNPTFLELARRVRDTVIAAQAHQDVPFEQVVEELQPERNPAVSPLFQVMFTLLNDPEVSLSISGLSVSLVEVRSALAKFDLTLSLHEWQGSLFGWLQYRTDLFDPATAARLVDHYTALLAASAAAPDRLLADLDLLSDAQRHQLLVEWNAAAWEAAGEPPAIRLFEAQASRTPEALALTVAGERLTYGDLDRRADRLARRLRRLGVGPEARVGLLLERSPDIVVAILAVWKAGGAYVPFSPDLPRERLDWMAADSGLAAVIAGEEPGWGVPLVHPGEGEDGGDLPAVEPGHLAYLIYTSGTTGRPKAVLVEHGSLSQMLHASRLRFGFDASDRALHLASFSFDISVFELLAPLLAGGTVELLTSAEILDLAGLAARVLGATRVQAVPSLTRQIVDQFAGPQTGPRTLFTGGERVPPDLLRDLRRTFPGAEVVVLYGPTEASVICSAEPLAGAVEERAVIGRPLPGSSLLVMDRDGNPAPVGVPGELLIGGPGVARGYLGRPDLTAEKYVPWQSGRLYRSGDLARWLPDGRIEFLGRVDNQVKIRGFRVEPGEIETLLRAEDGVRDAVVAVRERGGGRRLTAYVVPEREAPAGLFAALRSALEERLPEYMVPSAWVALPELPLTPHGKVDRRALPEPGEEPRRTAPPRTPVEEVLCSLWAEVLEIERVGIHDGFFDLGGHSLLATQLVSRLRRDLGVEIPLAAVFDGPSVAALAPRVEAALRGGAEAAPPIVPREWTAPLPLSFAQERLWFLDRLEPGPLYNIPTAARLTGPLHPPALAVALNEIVRRHATLRTRFAERDRRPVQEVLPWAPAALPMVDLSGLAEERRRQAVLERAAAEALRPFDLAAGRPLRTVLARLDREEHVLLLTVHHIAADGWSMGVLLSELSVLYAAALAGAPSPLPELPVQYVDFALWQREWLRGEKLERELDYWRRALEGAPEALDLPTDRPRQSQGAPRGGSRPFRIGRETWGALTVLARGRGWTPFMVLLAAFEELLARYSHQRDVVVGSPIANRNRAEIEGLIGFFANTLVLRLDLGGDPAFAGLVDRARGVTLEAYAHQDLPFEKLVENLAPRREAGRTPLFQVMLALQNAPLRLELPGLGLEVLELESATAKFDLVLALVEAEGGLSGGMEYDRGLFDEATVDRLLSHLGTFVAAAVAAPDTHLSSLGMLTAAERRQLAVWSRPPREYREGWCVHERVAARAALHPQAEAVVFGAESLTYGDFLRRSRRLAARLRELGVGPDVPVGIFLERSLDLPVAILAVLEAGGAYLPLDPGYPRERLRLMLEDAHAPVVLTQESLLGALPSGASQPLLVREIAGEAGPAPASPLAAVDPANLAYLIYTSGSTGRSKGVAMTHAAISAMLDWQLRTSAAGGGRTLQFAALSFDVSFQEMFSAWCAGGAVVMVSEDVRRDPPALLRLLEETRVERLFLPFVALQQLALATRAGEAPSSLREVMSAGEQLYVTPQVAAFFAALPGAELHNHYGPSETHAATWLALEGAPEGWPERPPVGVPLDHARIFVLDLELQPVPAGVTGEIFIGGRGLARGYLGRPRMTAERFLPDPFPEVEGWEPGSRLYRTGDLARWLPDGNVEYLGRGDHQVKIRGQRIEPGEVETALARHPAISQVAVAARGTGSGSRRLVAWVVFNEEAAPPAFAALKAFLAESLPDAMIPSVWMRLDGFPLTPSGKVDRRALPTPDVHTEDEAYQAPATPAEEMLAAIFAEVLGVRRVGARDDFFDLGGHSLLATQVMSRLRDSFGIEIPLRRLFEHPVLADLARAVEEALARGAPAADAPIPRVPRDGDLPLSYAQERLWFLDRLQPGSTVYSLPLVLRLEGELDVPVLAAAFAGIVARHETLRTVFADRGGEPVQVVRPAAGWSLPLLDLSGLAGRREEAGRIVAAWASVPFDLARGPVLHTTLLRLDARDHWLLLGLHHIVSDGWSMGVLVRELEALYAAFQEGRPSPLPELPVQYADFAVWQRRWLSGEVLERHVDYWRERLRGLPGEIELPMDRPRPAVRSTRGAVHPFGLDARLTAALTDLARQEGATPFMVLAASLLALLSRWSGQRDLAIGTPIANRNRAETEGLIGFFVNTLVLRGRLDDAPDFRALLRQVRETTLGAYAHQDLPFEKVIEELQPERDPSRTPFFQVLLALQNAPVPAAELPGLTLASEEPASGNAKFDLTMGLIHDGGGLGAAVEYSTDLFDRPTVARLAEAWRHLLTAAVTSPSARLAGLPVLSDAQRHQVLEEWNDTRRGWEGDPALHQLFERQADLRPGAVAGLCGDRTITYGELEAGANRLARHLRGLGVRRGQPVGLWMGRSMDLLVAVLGILKSGAVYVPLDAGWPAERVEIILAGTGTRVVVAGPDLAPGAVEVVRLDDPALAAAPAGRPEPVSDADDPAYLIHTSGSTGAPKGIVVRHRSAVNTLRWNNETLEIGPGDRHLFINSISFDLSIYDMLGLLGAGAAVRVATDDEVRDPERLAAILRDEGITTWSSAPAALQQLVPFFPPPGEGRALRRVLLAGDWIPLSLPGLLREAFPGALLGNFGGATETSVWSNWYRVDEVDPSWTGIPYGRPIASARYYVLDEELGPCPPGVAGDNYIGGGSPAMGYAGQPALTAERFLPDPFAEEPGARMYTTGDRARYRPDGVLEFLGRVDFQVKVRGYRIELGEIEAALARFPGVREAVALAREDAPGEKRLVAYVVPSGRPAPEAEELRAALYQTLPEYMVPWSYVFLESLPVTANGKLDRQALPAPGATGAGAVEYVAPRNELEREIAAVWRDVLEVERVGVHDNFFETGGSSLLIVKLHTRLKEALGLDVPVMELFRYTTVDALARKLAEEEPAAPAMKTGEIRERAKTRQDALRQLRQSRERKPR